MVETAPVVRPAVASLATTTMPLAPMSFAATVENWAEEKVVPKKRKNATLALFRKLASHTGHDVTGDVTPEELVSFKESLVKAVNRGDMAGGSLQNYCETLRTVFRHASKNKKITSNPAADLSYTAKADPRKERQDFSPADMKLILTECRKSQNPVVKIANLIAGFSGARLAEIVEANKADFEVIDGHLVFHIRLDNRAATETLKTLVSRRLRHHASSGVSASPPPPIGERDLSHRIC
jgi:integrase